MTNPLVSIIINNYNYAKFLQGAIGSALSQSYQNTEIVIVDDGSTDESREIVLRQKDPRIIPVLQNNGGQASALNAGVARSRGEILCFLDSDDFWTPDKVGSIVEVVQGQAGISKLILVHHFLEIMDQSTGKLAGQFMGNKHVSPCNLYGLARKYRFIPYLAGPTSSVSISRALAKRLFPLPELRGSISADDFIVFGASLIGELHSIDPVLGFYRVHDKNKWFNSDRRKSAEFVTALDCYLNDKLVANGRAPCIAFYESMYCWNQLIGDKRWLKLIGSMMKLMLTQRDRQTFKSVYETMKLVFDRTPLRKYPIFQRVIEITRPLRIRLLGW